VPFEGPTPSDVLATILEREPPPVSHYASEVPEDVSEVLVCYALGVYETQSNPRATRVIA
jgi:hypothetical protein